MKIVSQTSLESSLAQHIFSSFMWAITPHIPGEVFNKRDENSISHADLFRADDPRTLRSLKLQNSTITGMANAIQQSGLGSLQEVYMCIIPPLSSFRRLPAEAVIEFVRQQMREHEILGHWAAVAPGYIRLFRECKPFGPTHHVFQTATAILIDVFRYICNTLELRESQQRKDGIDELAEQKKEILQELQLGQRPPSDFMQNFVQLTSLQLRPKQGMWKDFGLEPKPNNDDGDGYFNHDPVFSRVMTGEMTDIERNDLYARDIFGWTPLHYATASGDGRVIKALITIGADSNARDLAEWTPLHYAIGGGILGEQIEKELESIIWGLLQNGSDTGIRGRDGIAPIHLAAAASNSSIRVLLQAGANPEMQDNSRKTPLHWAAFAGNTNGIRELFQKGIYSGVRDDYGRTPLHLAAVAGRHEAARELLEMGPGDRDTVDRDGRTALHLAAMKGDQNTLDVLLDRRGSEGRSKGHLGTADDYADIYDFIHHRDSGDCTPLHHAIMFGNEVATQALLDVMQEGDELWQEGFATAAFFARPIIVEAIASWARRRAILAQKQNAIEL